MKTSIGLCGATGKTPELQIGQVKTVDYTQKASVEITGTRENPILNFNIPKGKDGAKLIVREYFNGDIQILNNLNELPEDTNSDKYGKTVMSVNGIKQLLEKINDVLTKANANTNAIGSLTSTVQGNKSDIETKLNNFKSDTDTKVQSINQTISELEQTIETKLNKELTKQVKALQDENKKLNDMIFENSLKESFEGSTSSISDTSNGVAVIETIKGQTIVTDAPTEENPNLKTIESVGDKEGGKISILTHNKNLFNLSLIGGDINPSNGEVINNGMHAISDNFTEVSPNKTLTLSYTPIVHPQWFTIFYYDKDKIYISKNDETLTFVPPTNCRYIRFKIENSENVNINDCQIEYSPTKTSYTQHKEDKKEILIGLDGGLKSLPNGTCDTIEQREDGFYLVQRIGKYDVKEDDETQIDYMPPNQQDTIAFLINVNANNIKLVGGNICNTFDCFTSGDIYWNRDREGVLNSANAQFKFRILKSKLSSQDIDGIKAWLQANPVTIYYELETPVETKLDIDNLNLKTFKDLTYVTSENNIKPVLSGQATKDITTVIKNLQSKGAN